MKYKIVADPVFRTETLFYACNDGNQAIKHAKKYYNVNIRINAFDAFKGSCTELENLKTKGTSWLVWVKSCRDWKIMVHEAAHLTFRVLNNRGVGYSGGNDETWCYLQEFFIKEFWQVMTKSR